jgi:hypothetical protein
MGHPEAAPFGSPMDSREEVVAEMGAAYLCAGGEDLACRDQEIELHPLAG